VTSAIRAAGLSKRYGELAAVDGLDLTVERGELFGFLGPNGAGKTTTIRMALGLIHPSGGTIEVLGSTVTATGGPLELVGALVEEPAFWSYLSGRRNLEAFARAGSGRADVRTRLDRIDEVLHTVGLTDAADKRVKQYSQGMRQRLGIGLALLGDPQLLMLDEPTNGLDPSGMREIRELLRRLADGGTTIFISSHLLSEVEAMCDRVGVMARGKLVAEGPPGTLEGPTDRIRIGVDDVAKAKALLERLAGTDVEPSTSASGPGVLTVTLSDGLGPADVNAALVRGGIAVHALEPQRDTLEDVFLHLVEGIDVPR
jgi:ABC-type multidrug transport system ATPase subunit